MESDRWVSLALPPGLRSFLPAGKRGAGPTFPADRTSTLGHLLAAAGVPKTEVGGLFVGGEPVDLHYRPQPGDRIEVVEPTWPQTTPTSPPRFVLDVHLGTLARRLRVLGLDTAYETDASDDELLARSSSEQRVLLTRDRGLLHRRALRWGAHVNHQEPDDQLREFLARFAPPLRPWTRCPACNGELRDAPKSEVEAQIPPGTRRCYSTFRRCTACGKIYWPGAHLRRLQAIVDAASS
ncbi:Mut7-C ubiquitin/RNAse domain-containing protein [Nocardioides daeguensis]|uniref:Mut7-C RNAse domain-containing protein n=1 Tax=Nocardioides daeguensis TaxID=908359 RepID=A0ABP6USD5_9ACTN|nr:Mut7-C ubiquitin/RNAse domain-containing protein [Nocardioides daeguensis]MBV6725612.1 Mut7-C ubiquitin/RNAse domain-containing protein [Nocardioides daeguensis]MCR1772873.1 Mut7-C ubiquitin/RNAse domain-containing protein [Nocardioides daeguensis]